MVIGHFFLPHPPSPSPKGEGVTVVANFLPMKYATSPLGEGWGEVEKNSDFLGKFAHCHLTSVVNKKMVDNKYLICYHNTV